MTDIMQPDENLQSNDSGTLGNKLQIPLNKDVSCDEGHLPQIHLSVSFTYSSSMYHLWKNNKRAIQFFSIFTPVGFASFH